MFDIRIAFPNMNRAFIEETLCAIDFPMRCYFRLQPLYKGNCGCSSGLNVSRVSRSFAAFATDAISTASVLYMLSDASELPRVFNADEPLCSFVDGAARFI